ncbi:hypothetical protein F2P81_025142 [Scophthalmus maximus]|uniref:Uncharacterized protein n=1 Tax=Scophthalmus maximus TaxID=52904 RepID=A0A6A4RJ86_SCOMX|nr:hypothetical protein F2P81_025142 [Scophthalmus maximus]
MNDSSPVYEILENSATTRDEVITSVDEAMRRSRVGIDHIVTIVMTEANDTAKRTDKSTDRKRTDRKRTDKSTDRKRTDRKRTDKEEDKQEEDRQVDRQEEDRQEEDRQEEDRQEVDV